MVLSEILPGPLTTVHSGRVALTGIVSFGKGCAGKPPGVYTRASNYEKWIRDESGNDACFIDVS